MTTAALKSDMRQMRDRLMQRADDETNPIKRLYNEYNVPAGAVLRLRYDEFEFNDRLVGQTEERIAELESEIRASRWEGAQLLPQSAPMPSVPIPTKEQTSRLPAIRAHIEVLEHWLALHKAAHEGLVMRRNDYHRAWAQLHEQWRVLKWRQTGDAAFQPPMLAVNADGKSWEPVPGYDMQGLLKQLGYVEGIAGG